MGQSRLVHLEPCLRRVGRSRLSCTAAAWTLFALGQACGSVGIYCCEFMPKSEGQKERMREKQIDREKERILISRMWDCFLVMTPCSSVSHKWLEMETEEERNAM